MEKLTFLDHGVTQIAIIVEDLDRTVDNYWNAFGIGPWYFYTYGHPLLKQMSYYGKTANYKIRIALSYFGPLRVELIEILEGESIYADFVEEHGYGLHHLGLLVDDIVEALSKANEAGFSMIQDGAGFGLDGDGHFAYLDTEKRLGVTLEFIKRPKRRVPPEKIYPLETSSK